MRPPLSIWKLSLRGTIHHRRILAYTMLSAATATAVITGALLVGDSLRGSLAARVEERLGGIDHALLARTFFRQSLAEDLRGLPGVRTAVPAILLSGTVSAAEGKGGAAGEVDVIGVPAEFWDFWASSGSGEAREFSQSAGLPNRTTADLSRALEGRTAILGGGLAHTLRAFRGGAVVVRFDRAADIPAEVAFGRRAPRIPALRLEVAAVLSDRGPSLFTLEQSQRTPRNVFVPLDLLATTLGKKGLANAILMGTGPVSKGTPSAAPSRTGLQSGVPAQSADTAHSTGPAQSTGPAPGEEGDAAEAALHRSALERWTLEDLGLSLRPDPVRGHVSLESRGLLLSRPVVEAARAVVADRGAASEPAALRGIRSLEVLTYLATAMAVGDRELPYSTVSAVGEWAGAEASERSPVFEGQPIRPGHILLNDWAAEDLGARAGDSLRMRYFVVGRDHSLEEKEAAFTVEGIVPMEGPAGDPGWTPDYPGISEARTVRDWDPPFPVDYGRIRKKDDEYWDRHRATPKAFVSIEDGKRLWSSRFGDLTAVRFRAFPAAPAETGTLAEAVAGALRLRLDPTALGVAARSLKAEGLEAARGATDFSGLFLALSFFLIAAAVILLSMVFRLACERRSGELGILAAVGYPEGTLRRLLVLESAWVLLAGSALGIAGGVGYGAFLVEGLRTWWSGAVSAPFLSLHVTAGSLIAGAAATGLLALGTAFLVARRASRAAPRALIERADLAPASRVGGRWRRSRHIRLGIGIAGAALAAAIALLGPRLPGRLSMGAQVAFFGAGACLLVSGLALVDFRLRSSSRMLAPRSPARGRGLAALARLGVSYAGRAPGRSLLVISLIACASFLIVTVATVGGEEGRAAPDKGSGDGGFSLVGRFASPVTASLSTKEGREALGIAAETSSLLDRSKVFPFRLREGDDLSCLNLYRPRAATILGAPREFIDRGGFAWAGSLAEGPEERRNPWRLLDRAFPDGAIPAVGDASTITWILKAGLGKDVETTDDEGRPVRLRIVGTLSGSIFQGELVVSEESLLSRFPGVVGHRFFLVESDPIGAGQLESRLEEDLSDLGLKVETTAEVLSGYRAVAGTYIATFQFLGALGLLLGTVGLGAVLARSAAERRGELALLRALGYSQRAVGWIILSETTFLLLAGLAVGAIASLVPLIPAAAGAGGAVSWGSLAAALGAVLAAGLLSSGAAMRSALRTPIVSALRSP